MIVCSKISVAGFIVYRFIFQFYAVVELKETLGSMSIHVSTLMDWKHEMLRLMFSYY